jgi:hypothetical protein
MDVYGHVLPATDESVTDAMEAMFSTRFRESRGLLAACATNELVAVEGA